jgi:hypothetical protein
MCRERSTDINLSDVILILILQLIAPRVVCTMSFAALASTVCIVVVFDNGLARKSRWNEGKGDVYGNNGMVLIVEF